MNDRKYYYMIGEDKPFRYTKETGERLAWAIISSNAVVLSSSIVHMWPFTNIKMNLQMTEAQYVKFEEILWSVAEKSECESFVKMTYDP